ncbi:MAG: family 10 glycosylhydrolase [Paludibacter sp.]
MKNLFLILSCVILLSCKPTLEGGNVITSFKFQEITQADEATISHDTVSIMVPTSTDLTTLTPIIEVSPKATINPASGVKQDFSKPVFYTVTSEAGTKKNFTVLAYSQPTFRVNNIQLPDNFVTGVINGDNITFTVPFGTNVSALKFTYLLVDNGLTSNIVSGSNVDLTQPFTWKLSIGNLSKTYTITVNIQPQETGIRAVWVTNVASSVLFSEAGLTAMVDKLAELNFNTICVCTYNKSQTLFPSQTLANVLGLTPAQTVIAGCSWGDVLGKLIEKAHAKNIKVIAWFEYGFASHYSGQDSPISDKHPDWVSKDIAGNQTEKNKFYWLNGFHPEVQKFLTDMIVECVTKYPGLDGVQGDDRLPALPSHAGYDDHTKQLYKTETGKDVPTNPTETAFFNWKANKMSDYAVSLYNAVKTARSSCLVTWAPSTRGWSKDNYLQDWPEWLKRGVADWISPQLYRNESQGIDSYSTLLYSDVQNVFNTVELRKKYVPGMLVRNGTVIVTDGFLAQLIQYNRSRGVFNESTWFYEAIPSKQKAFKALYPGKAIFPF